MPLGGIERGRAARAPDENGERFRSLFEAVGVGVVLAGPAAEVKDCNQAALDLLGLTRDQLVGKTSFDLEWKAKWEDGSPCSGEQHPIPRAIATRQRVRGEVIGVYRPRLQDWVWLLVNAEPRLAEDGSVAEVICSFTDVTENKRAEEALRASEERFRKVFAHAATGITLQNVEGVFLMVNRAFCRITGREERELIGASCRSITHPDDFVDDLSKRQELLAGRVPSLVTEKRYLSKDGRVVWVRNSVSLLRDSGGEPLQVIVLVEDITDSKRAEEALRASEERFRRVFAHAATGMTLQSVEGVFLEVNRAFCEITGYDEQDLVGANVHSITHPEDIARDLSLRQRLLAGQVPSVVAEKRYLSKCGRVVWVRNSVSAVRDCEGIPPHLIVLVEDITDSKRAEEALRASEERFRKVFAHAATGMTLQNLEGVYLEVNQAFCEITGYEERDLIGTNYRSVTHPEDLARNVSEMQELLAGEIPSFVLEKRYVRKDGRSVWVRNSVSLLGDSKPARIITLVEDIAERKQAEEALRQLSGRLLQVQDEERRRLARELHDGTAQSIAGLGMKLSVVRESAAALDPCAQKALNESIDLAEQCIRELRTLSYLLHPPMLDDRGLAPALAGYAEGFAQRSGIAVKLDLTPDVGRLPQEVELMLFRVVQESLTNIHHHSGSRTATIRLARYPQDIVLQVRDQGSGIDRMNLDGAPGMRLGVGIAGMRERVRQIGGTLQIRSRPGGTDVEVVVPLFDPYR